MDAGTASEELERFLRDWPRSDLAADAALELGRRATEADELDAAARHLLWATRMHPRGDRIDEIQVLLAEVEQRRGHTEAAYRTAARIRISHLGDALISITFEHAANNTLEYGRVTTQSVGSGHCTFTTYQYLGYVIGNTLIQHELNTTFINLRRRRATFNQYTHDLV